MQISSPADVYRKLLLLTLALLLGALELFIPRMPLFPWLKPGLANIITMIWLIRYGVRDTLLFGFLRIWINALFFGFSLFALFPAFSGMVFSVLGVSLLLRINRITPAFGFVGLGIFGAFLHNAGQLAALQILVGEASMADLQFPVMIGAALLFGTLTGLLAWKFDQIELGAGDVLRKELAVHSVSLVKKILSSLLLVLTAAVLFVKSPYLLLLFAAGSAVSAAWAVGSAKPLLTALHRSWFFLLTVSAASFWVSGDGSEAVNHLLRLMGWIFCTELFRKLETDRLFFRFLYRLFPNRESTLAAALITVEVFPELMKNSAVKAVIRPLMLIKNPAAYLHTLVEMSHDILEEGGWGKRRR